MKRFIALILFISMMTVLYAVAESSDVILQIDDTIQSAIEEITIEGELADKDNLDLDMTDDVILDDEALFIDELSLDGFESAPHTVEQSDLEDNAENLASNTSNTEDFIIDENGVLVKYVGAGGDVVIPDGVTGIGDEAFYHCESMITVVIPDSINSIGDCAFWCCRNLVNVVIPNSVTSIGNNAFFYCDSLKDVTIGANVTSIGAGAFDECLSLTSVIIPDSVTSIGSGAFDICENLTSLTIGAGLTNIGEEAFSRCGITSILIPDNVITIGELAFSGCDKLTSVTIGTGVTSISYDAFMGCDNLETFIVSEQNQSYVSEDGILYTRDLKTLLLCPTGKASVTIPDNVITIGEGAFFNCNLTDVRIGAGVKYIMDSAFVVCENLKSVTIPDNVISIDDHAFWGCKSMGNVSIGVGVTSIGIGAFMECRNLTSIIIPDNVTVMGDYVFRYCVSLTSVTIPPSVTKIGKGAFDACDKLTINGISASYAETYAKEEGIPFIAIAQKSVNNAVIMVRDQVYSGKTLKPSVKVVLDGNTLQKDTDYNVAYKNNKVIGTATVTVSGKGNYTGTAKATFKINPRAVTGLKLSAGKGHINANWKKSADRVGGYQLQYSTKKSFSGAKMVNISKPGIVKRALKGLTTGKTYYVRIRAFKKVGKNTYYSVWSATKAAKVK